MLLTLFYLILCVLSFSNSFALEFEKTDGSALYFKKEGDKEIPPVKTNLFEVSFLGLLRSSSPLKPLVLVEGRPCQNCLQDKSLYLIFLDGQKATQLVYPGKIIDQKTNQVVYESRVFFGQCLGQHPKSLKKYFPTLEEDFSGDVYLNFQKEKVDRRSHLQKSVFISVPGKTLVHERLLERNQPDLPSVLQKTKKKLCFEIPGRARRMLAHAFKDEHEEDEHEEGAPEKGVPEKETKE